MPGAGYGDGWQVPTPAPFGGSAPGADANPYGYAGEETYPGYSGHAGFPGGSAAGGPSGYPDQSYGGVPGQSGPPRTGVYPYGPTGLEQQYGSWGATGAQAPSWYPGGVDQQPAYSPQYRFRADPQIDKPQEAQLPKFRPYDSQPGSAMGPSGLWQSSAGAPMAPAPVFRPIEKEEPSAAAPRQDGAYAEPGLGIPPAPLGYPGVGPPYGGGAWGYPGGAPSPWEEGGIWPGGYGGGLPPW